MEGDPLSIEALIDQYGVDGTRRRLSFGKTSMGGAKVSGETQETIRLLMQNGGGSTSNRYGAERASYAVVAYAKAGTDIIEKDLYDWNGKTYRVDSARVPDERPVGDALSYVILGLSQEEGIT